MSLLRLPFLARQPMSVARTKTTNLMNFARNYPMMSRVLKSLHPAAQLHTSGVKTAVSGSRDGNLKAGDESKSEWRITVHNITGNDGLKPRNVEFMLFQVVPDPFIVESHSTAWKVSEVAYPGLVGPIVLPAIVEFAVWDTSDGLPRMTGPFPIQFGEVVNVQQRFLGTPPKPETAPNETQPKGEIKVTNVKGNIQPLEMALNKNGAKMVSYKGVNPGQAVNLAIAPHIYIADICASGFVEGDDFKSVVQAAHSTSFDLRADQLDVHIDIKQQGNGQIDFVKRL